MKQVSLNLNLWRPRLANLVMPEYYRRRTINVSGPSGLECYLRVMEEAAGKRLVACHSSVNCLIWGQGEPHNPAQTKIGGLPYRSRDLTWPADQSGSPIPFFAQFNFTACAQQPPTRNELLVTFADVKYGEVVEFAYEWYSLRDPSLALVEPPKNTIPWPSQSMYAEVTTLPIYRNLGTLRTFERACADADFSIDTIRVPQVGLLFSWDGLPSESGDLKLLVSLDSLRPVWDSEWTWLTGPEKAFGFYDVNGQPIRSDYREDHRPNRWLETDHYGTFYFYVDCLGDVCLECAQFLPGVRNPFT